MTACRCSADEMVALTSLSGIMANGNQLVDIKRAPGQKTLRGDLARLQLKNGLMGLGQSTGTARANIHVRRRCSKASVLHGLFLQLNRIFTRDPPLP